MFAADRRRTSFHHEKGTLEYPKQIYYGNDFKFSFFRSFVCDVPMF